MYRTGNMTFGKPKADGIPAALSLNVSVLSSLVVMFPCPSYGLCA